MRAVQTLAASVAFGLLVSAGSVRAAAPEGAEKLAAEARAVLDTYCYRCHGRDGRNEGGLNVVTDLKKLVESGRVEPGAPERSKLIKRVVGGDMPPEVDFEDRSENPPALPRPGEGQLAALRAWVKAGAPAGSGPASAAAGGKFIPEPDVLKAVADDLRASGPRDRRFRRYFTLTHLANAGNNDDQLQTYRHALSKLVNSLSWDRKIKAPTAVDPARTVLRVDLRDYLWDDRTWDAVLDQYPYGLKPEGAAAASVAEMAGCDLPYVRADWFVFAASRPPLYHDVLRLPRDIGDLERKLDVDVEADVRRDRVARAGFNASGVSRNNRLIERHESTNGAYWRSYDFAGNAGAKNLFARPLGPGDGPHDFTPDGGEVVFTLPNGLNGYALIDGDGGRIDKGPTGVVRDNKQADGAVVNGISCMSCHNRGFIEKADQVREVVARNKSFDPESAETVRALYPPRERMDELIAADLARFARAVKETGASLSRTEPVFALATQFEGEVGPALAAAEAGLRPKDFDALLAKTPELAEALGPLLAGGAVKRDVYVAAFPLIAAARQLTLRDAKAAPAALASDARPAAPSTARVASPTLSVPAGPQRQGPMRQGGGGARSQSPSQSGPRSALGFSAPVRATPSVGGSRKGYAADLVEERPPKFFGGDRDRFRDVAPAGAVLAGVRVTTVFTFGGPKVSSVQPLYRRDAKLFEGSRYGAPMSPEVTALAKPGYAVGAVRTHTGLSVDGFELVFMRLKGDRLDPSDSYASPWLGDPNGGSPTSVDGDGRLIVGVQGRADKKLHALGLCVLK